MKSSKLKPDNLPETLVWYYIIGTYVCYLFGGQYLVAPLLATFLVCLVFKQWWYQTPKTPLSQRIDLAPLTWIWIVGMVIMEIALIIGHLNFDLDLAQIIKSSLYWYKHWALFALFAVAGYLKIRPQIIYRASCILCTICLVLVLVGSLAYMLNLPSFSYISPLQAFGGDDLYYQIDIPYQEPGYGKEFRLQLFAPWPPALGFLGNTYFFLANQENVPQWRWLGMVGAIAMIVMSVSRLAVVCLLFVLFAQWFLNNFHRTKFQLTISVLGFIMGISFPILVSWFEALKKKFYELRPGSSRVRAALGRMTLDSWWNEAPVWGHGINTSRGPAALGYMPIGTHHTWYGVLYLHGVVGFFCFFIPFVLTFLNLLAQVRNSSIARVSLCLMLVLLLFSFGENIENLAYLYWPALLIISIAIKESASQVILDRQPLSFDSN